MPPRKRPLDSLEEIKKLESCPGCLLILCPDEIRRQRAANLIIRHFFGEDRPPEMNSFDGSRIDQRSMQAFIDETLSPSLFSAHRIFIIRHVDELASALSAQFIAALERLQGGVTVIATASSLAASSPVLKFFRERKLEIEIPELKGHELSRWVQKEMKGSGLASFSDHAVETLINLGGESPDQIHSLVEQLALYLDSSEVLDSDVHKLFVERIEPSEFALIDALQDRNPAKKELLVDQLLSSGKSAFALLAMISKIFSNYFLIKLLSHSGRNSNDIRQDLNMTPWVFTRSSQAAARYSLEQLRSFQKAVLHADSQLKNRSLGPDVVLSELLGKTCGMSPIKLMLTACALLLTCCTAGRGGQLPQAGPMARPSTAIANPDTGLRGWEYLALSLRADGISEEAIRAVYGNSRMPRFENIPFQLRPAETRHMYRRFIDRQKLKTAHSYLKTHSAAFELAQKTFGVNRNIVAAILLIESEFGRNSGNELVINRLSRLAAIGAPQNLEWNFRRLSREDSRVTLDQVKTRARYLESTFYPEVLALFEIAKRENLDVFLLRGSRAGAFGMPQFLPGSYLKYAVDCDHDGLISLFRDEDSICSVGNYLMKSGWQESASLEVKKKAIWKYNHSEPYIETVLKLAEMLKK